MPRKSRRHNRQLHDFPSRHLQQEGSNEFLIAYKSCCPISGKYANSQPAPEAEGERLARVRQ